MCGNWGYYSPYDVTKDYPYPYPGEGPFYTDYFKHARTERDDIGIDKCNWKETNTYLVAHKDEIVERFNAYYDYREIGQETYIRFQNFLNRRFNELQDNYNHAFEMYETNDINDLGIGYEETENHTRDFNRNDTSNVNENSTNKFKDTPTSVAGINNPTTESEDTAESEGTGSRTENETKSTIHKKIQHDEHTLTEVNTNINVYRDLINDFVRAFEPCFIQLLQ